MYGTVKFLVPQKDWVGRRKKKRCWRQALSFLSDNPRHYTPPSLYMVLLYIRRELERCTRLQPYWKKSLFRTTWHKDPFSIALFKSAAASARVYVCLYVCSFAIFFINKVTLAHFICWFFIFFPIFLFRLELYFQIQT